MREGAWSFVRRALREIRVALYDLVVPSTCAGCGQLAAGCCEACAGRLEPLPPDGCARCGEPLAASRCTADHAALRGIALRRAAWRYRGTGGAIVRRFKFQGDAAARQAMVRAMAERARGIVRGAGRRARFVHVPVHPRKLRRRGFDQAARLADGIARRLGRPFVPGVLRRLVDTLPQGDPLVTSRERNVGGVFAVVRPRAVRGRTIVLVDDVSTSGATARECARVLREAGARSVVLLTAAVG